MVDARRLLSQRRGVSAVGALIFLALVSLPPVLSLAGVALLRIEAFMAPFYVCAYTIFPHFALGHRTGIHFDFVSTGAAAFALATQWLTAAAAFGFATRRLSPPLQGLFAPFAVAATVALFYAVVHLFGLEVHFELL